MSTVRVVSPVYSRILCKFPKSCSFSFAYGSGVKPQTGTIKSEQMIDLIISTEDSLQWHADNLKTNGSHYSFLKYLGGGLVTKYQESLGAQVYFNTLIPIKEEGVLIKYGVVSKKDLIADLLDWDYLYLAGRLHKPVEVILTETDARLHTALQANLTSAVHSALLLLPEKFTEFQFYHTISNLSYSGDFRMIFGEDKNKVKSIVEPQVAKFRHLYTPTITNLKTLIHFAPEGGDGNCQQDISPGAKHYHLSQLPSNPLRLIEIFHFKKSMGKEAGTGDVLDHLAHDPKCADILKKALSTIVWQSSVRQSIKGILTAGLFKSLNYSTRKIGKMFK